MSEIEETPSSRTAELVLGTIEGIFGLMGAIFALLLSSIFGDYVNSESLSIGALGLSAFLASIIGIFGAVYIKSNPKVGGIITIIAAIWLLISISLFGALGFILLLIAGIL
ncbi:MAG: DUF4064 domain-containing protein [Methanobrevibacter sp.]|jgi:hypothetical protein|nr:DUF4064 domain-containing protein [Methanobrevibacter sp.]